MSDELDTMNMLAEGKNHSGDLDVIADIAPPPPMVRRRYPEKGDTVKVLSFIGKEFEDDKVGTVVARDGEYVDVVLNKSNVLVERYPNELRILPPKPKMPPCRLSCGCCGYTAPEPEFHRNHKYCSMEIFIWVGFGALVAALTITPLMVMYINMTS